MYFHVLTDRFNAVFGYFNNVLSVCLSNVCLWLECIVIMYFALKISSCLDREFGLKFKNEIRMDPVQREIKAKIQDQQLRIYAL